MNKRELLYLVSGMAIGAAGAIIGLKEYFTIKMNDEISALADYYDQKIDDIKAGLKFHDPEIDADFDEQEKKEKKVESKRSAKPDAEVEPDYKEIIEKLNYNQYSTKSSKETGPYIISFEEYSDYTNYIKKIVSYFSEDEVAMDSETEEVIDDVNKVLGFKNLEDFGDNNEIYIRNEELGTDYQVVLETSSYQDFLNEEF